MSDPNQVRNISVTLKGDGKDATWVVFHGSVAAVREQIEEARESGLFDLINEVTAEYKAVGNVVQKLGAKVVDGEAKAEPSEDDHIKGLIEAASTVAELTDIWVRYQDKIKGTPLFDLMGKRSGELG